VPGDVDSPLLLSGAEVGMLTNEYIWSGLGGRPEPDINLTGWRKGNAARTRPGERRRPLISRERTGGLGGLMVNDKVREYGDS